MDEAKPVATYLTTPTKATVTTRNSGEAGEPQRYMEISRVDEEMRHDSGGLKV